MDMTVIKEIVGSAVAYVLLLVVGIVVSVVGKALNQWLSARAAAEDADKSLSEESEKSMFLSMVQDIIDGVVNAVGQTLVSGVKGTAAWTEEKKEEAFDAALNGVANILSETDLEKLAAIFDDAEEWVISRIEAAVLKNKGKWAESSACEANAESDPVVPAGISDTANEAATYDDPV